MSTHVVSSPWMACDLRGVYPDSVSPELFRDIGGAIGTILSPRPLIVIAGDFRTSTPELKQALGAGLQQTGAIVIDAGQGPTPVAYFAARHVNADAVLIVTASHNPATYNGLKLMLNSTPTTPHELKRIRDVCEVRDFRHGRGSGRNIQIHSQYADAMAERWKHLKDTLSLPRLILDAGNGAWSEMAPQIFLRLGFDIRCISCVPDGNFPDRSPDCASSANLAQLRAVVQEQTPSIGIAWDGDGDRVAFIDEEGEYVTPDEVAILLARAICNSKEADRPDPKVVIDIKHSQVVASAVQECGGRPLLEKTGHAFMRSRMVAEDAALGLDACGHYFFRELHGGDDGLFAALFLLDILRQERVSLAELRRRLPRIYSSPEMRIPNRVLSWDRASNALRTHVAEADVSVLDGLRFATNDGIVLIRESGTEPILSLRMEGFSPESYERVLQKCKLALPELAGSVA
jgi:phosphomannomutase / phosphoglucomutase